MEKRMEFTCRLTAKDVYEMNCCATAPRLNLLCAILMGIVLIYMGVNAALSGQSIGAAALSLGLTAAVMLAITALVRIVTNALLLRRIKRTFGTLKSYDILYTMNRKALKYEQSGSKNYFYWEKIRYVKETRNLYVIRANASDIAAFTKRDVPDEEALRQLLKDAVPAKKLKLRKRA